MKVKRSYDQLFEFNSFASRYAEKNKDNKLTASINNVFKQLKEPFEDYADERDTLQINNCLVDEKTKAILKHADGSRHFSQEGEKKLKKEIKELGKKEIEIHARIADGINDLIESLTDFEKDAFSGIVIPEQTTTTV